jgi:uncharacterized protein YggE
MSRRLVLVAPVVVALLAAGPAAAQQAPTQAQTITATGTGQSRVLPKNRHSSASIAAAVEAARKASIGSALSQAREYAREYAKAVGLALGSVISVSDAQPSGFYPPGPGAFGGPFGQNQYCGTIHRVVGRPTPGKRPKFKKVHRCFVPRFASKTLTVTYSAS